MHIKIIKPDAIVFEGDVNLVQLPGTDGKFEILNNHTPIIASLNNGSIRIVKTNNEEETFPILAGVVRCKNNEILVIAQ